MSKLVSDIVEEFHSIEKLEDDFELFIMNIIIDENGEIESTQSIEAVSQIQVDETHQECLFHYSAESKALTIGEAMKAISNVNSDYLLVSTDGNSIDDPTFTNNVSNSITNSTSNNLTNNDESLDNPIIGFGENIEQKRFFIVCEAFEVNIVLH